METQPQTAAVETTQETAAAADKPAKAKWFAVLKNEVDGRHFVAATSKAELKAKIEEIGLQNVETTFRGTENPLKTSF